MRNPTDAEIEQRLVGIISDGFNRSLNALREAGAIDTKKMDAKYKGIGSKYYDLVTDEIDYTAKWSVPALRQLFDGPSGDAQKNGTHEAS